MSFSVTRLLRKVPVSEQLKEIGTFINRELLPYLHELRESLKTAFETPSDGLDIIGDTEGSILVRGEDEWEAVPKHLRFIQRRYLTSGTSITHHDDAVAILVKGVGGGGSGGGCTGAGGIGSCGGSGCYGEKFFTLESLTSTYVVGSNGAAASAAAGNAGTLSSFTHGLTTVSLPPGNGGGIGAAGGTALVVNGGAGGGASTNTDFEIQGKNGGRAVRGAATNPVWHSGGGGETPLGTGAAGRATVTQSTGGIGGGFGVGGCGALNGTTATDATSGAGTPGIWIVDEYA